MKLKTQIKLLSKAIGIGYHYIRGVYQVECFRENRRHAVQRRMGDGYEVKWSYDGKISITELSSTVGYCLPPRTPLFLIIILFQQTADTHREFKERLDAHKEAAELMRKEMAAKQLAEEIK